MERTGRGERGEGGEGGKGGSLCIRYIDIESYMHKRPFANIIPPYIREYTHTTIIRS
jgi:hypothetical protein